MKKVIRILLIFSILCTSSCDFLRKVAGRPTEADLKVKAECLEHSRQEAQDSISAALEALRAEQIRDSLEAVGTLDSLGVKMSSVFRFGDPLEGLECRYNLIIGVFRNKSIVDAKCKVAAGSGFQPFLISFDGGVTALCLCGSDSLGDVLDACLAGRKANVCPSDAWVYVRQEDRQVTGR